MMKKNLSRVVVERQVKKSGKLGKVFFKPSRDALIRNYGLDKTDLSFFLSGAPSIHLWKDEADYILIKDTVGESYIGGIFKTTSPVRLFVYERRENSDYKKRMDAEIRFRNSGGKGLV